MISIIICSIDPEKFRSVTACYHALLGSEPFEIIGIHDAQSLSEGYNRGVARSRGDVLIFSHDDIEILSPDFLPKLKAHLKRFDVVGPVGTQRALDGLWVSAGAPYLQGQAVIPAQDGSGYLLSIYDHGRAAAAGVSAVGAIQQLDGFFFTARREVLDAVSFDEQTFDRFHGYDVDFSYRAHLAGFRIGVCSDIAILHFSPGSFEQEWRHYAARFASKHAATLPGPEHIPPFRADWLVVSCATKEDVAAAFSIPVRQQLAQRAAVLAAAVATAPAKEAGLLRTVLAAILRR